MSLLSLNAEALQLLILSELSKGPISDTRQLALGNGDVAGPDGDAQLVIKGALDSLVAREVSLQTRFRGCCTPGSTFSRAGSGQSEEDNSMLTHFSSL